MADRIHQEEVFRAAPAAVYDVLTDSARFSEATGAPATIDSSAGGEFTLFGGAITGRTIEFLRGQRLVQAWRSGGWDPGVYSLVRFELAADDGGTRVTLDHAGFPQGQAEHLAGGWDANYWQALHKLLG